MMRRMTGTLAILALAACGGGSENSPAGGNSSVAPAAEEPSGFPKFVTADYIELAKIGQISRFRSAVGHDFSDSFETARSMKHYFVPSVSDWSSVRIYSPVDGTVAQVVSEWAGKQLRIVPTAQPDYTVRLFHVNTSITAGAQVTAGQLLGTHIGSQTYSDVAVEYNNPQGWQLVSYFDVMTSAVFQAYQARGVGSPSALIITKAQRDADPLTVDGNGNFATQGSLPNWVTLN